MRFGAIKTQYHGEITNVGPCAN